MTLRELEKRLETVEAELAALKAKVGRRPKNPRWYRDNAGVFADDPALAEAARLGQEYRDRVNREPLRPKRKSNKIRIGTMDLRIAIIALAHSATLVTANVSDFRKVPGLTVEDWTKPDLGS